MASIIHVLFSMVYSIYTVGSFSRSFFFIRRGSYRLEMEKDDLRAADASVGFFSEMIRSFII